MTQTVTQSGTELHAPQTTGVRGLLLLCGILAPLLYIGADILAASRFEGYSYTSQTISELMAIGAPTRPLLIALFLPWNVLVAAFGIGVWASAGGKRALRISGILLVACSAVSLAGLSSPMHLRGAAGATAGGGMHIADVMHILITMTIVLFTLLYIAFGAAALGKGFCLYSIGTILAMLVFGGLAGMQGPRIAANLPTPWVGVCERASVYFSMVWMLVLAVALMRARRASIRA